MGRGARKRYWRNIKISILVGLLISGIMFAVVYYMDKI